MGLFDDARTCSPYVAGEVTRQYEWTAQQSAECVGAEQEVTEEGCFDGEDG